MCDRETKKQFKITDLLIAGIGVIVIPLLLMNYNKILDVSNAIQVQDVRIQVLENWKDRGDRFTKTDGIILQKDGQHTREMLMRHIKKSEPILQELHDHMITGKN